MPDILFRRIFRQKAMKHTVNPRPAPGGHHAEDVTDRIATRDGQLGLTLYPNSGAETIILLHGGPGVPTPMVEVAQILQAQYQVIFFAQRGTGLSPCRKCSYDIPNYLDDLNAIADHFALDQFHIFGHSWGGLYAQIYAQEYPGRLRSVFLCSPSSGTNTDWQQTEQEVLQYSKERTNQSEWLRMGWYSLLGLLGSDRAYQHLFRQVLKNYHRGWTTVPPSEDVLKQIRAKPINQTRKAILKYPSLRPITDLPFPLLIVYGDQDIYGASTAKLRDRYPAATYQEIQNCGHIPWVHQPAAFRQILKDFYGLTTANE